MKVDRPLPRETQELRYGIRLVVPTLLTSPYSRQPVAYVRSPSRSIMIEPTEIVGDGDALPSTDAASLERLKRFGGGKLLSEMIALFIVAAPERISAARAGLDAGDANAAEMALHSLKSSSAQLGAMKMQRLSEAGERLARSGSLDGVESIVMDLESEFPRIQQWLERSRTVENPQ